MYRCVCVRFAEELKRSALPPETALIPGQKMRAMEISGLAEKDPQVFHALVPHVSKHDGTSNSHVSASWKDIGVTLIWGVQSNRVFIGLLITLTNCQWLSAHINQVRYTRK